ncbi:MAG: hypothetical protein ACJ8AW_55145, partial [Rhodopila sp.]
SMSDGVDRLWATLASLARCTRFRAAATPTPVLPFETADPSAVVPAPKLVLLEETVVAPETLDETDEPRLAVTVDPRSRTAIAPAAETGCSTN